MRTWTACGAAEEHSHDNEYVLPIRSLGRQGQRRTSIARATVINLPETIFGGVRTGGKPAAADMQSALDSIARASAARPRSKDLSD